MDKRIAFLGAAAIAVGAALGIYAMTSLASPSGAVAIANASEEASIKRVLSSQAEAWNRGDIPAFMDGYWRSDGLRFASGNTVQRGYKSTLDRYVTSYDTPEKMGTLDFQDLEVEVISDEAAVVFGRFLLVRPEEGDATGLFTLIFKKIEGQWKIVHDHTSS